MILAIFYFVLVAVVNQLVDHGIADAFSSSCIFYSCRGQLAFKQPFLFKGDSDFVATKSESLDEDASNMEEVTQLEPRPQKVQFAAPLLDYGYPPTVQEFNNGSLSEKPILLYLPGFDGTYICPFIQFPELGTEFELWCMTVGMDDRSTFEELEGHVLDFIESISTVPVEKVVNITSSSDQNKTKTNDGEPKKEKNDSREVSRGFLAGLFSRSEDDISDRASTKFMKQKRLGRPIYLAGESFGGILASKVALTLLENNKKEEGEIDVNLQGLVLVNPATCFDRSQLAAKGPPVYQLPALLYPFGLGRLLPLFTDEYSVEQLFLILQAKALPSVIDTPARESFMGRVAFSLPTKLEYMNQGTLEWRLEEWLSVGCDQMASEIDKFGDYPSLRTLIVVGERDLTLPSIAEAERLVNILPSSQVHVVEGAGHASTCGSRIDLTAQMRQAFPELQASPKQKRKMASTKRRTATQPVVDSKRTAMKSTATEGSGAYFGMEPRYDGASIGLNPILYWSKENFQRVKQSAAQQVSTSTSDFGDSRQYSKSIYVRSEPSSS